MQDHLVVSDVEKGFLVGDDSEQVQMQDHFVVSEMNKQDHFVVSDVEKVLLVSDDSGQVDQLVVLDVEEVLTISDLSDCFGKDIPVPGGRLLRYQKVTKPRYKKDEMRDCPQPYCPLQSDRNSNLKRHVAAIHTDVPAAAAKPTCCGLAFAQKGLEDLHKILSHGKWPNNGKQEGEFSCVQCTKKFRTKALLNRHLENHKDVKRYKCAWCLSYRAATRSNLLRHQASRHKLEVARERASRQGSLHEMVDDDDDDAGEEGDVPPPDDDGTIPEFFICNVADPI
jgi:hypothetical protein